MDKNNENTSIKDDRINFRISSSKKNDFAFICKNLFESSLSKKIEEYIDEVIKDNEYYLEIFRRNPGEVDDYDDSYVWPDDIDDNAEDY